MEPFFSTGRIGLSRARAAFCGAVRDNRGTAAVEYGLLASLVGVGLIGTVALMGDRVETTISQTSQTLVVRTGANASGTESASGDQGAAGSASSNETSTDGSGAAASDNGDGTTTASGSSRAGSGVGSGAGGDSADGAATASDGTHGSGSGTVNTSGSGGSVGSDCSSGRSHNHDDRCDDSGPGHSGSRHGRG